MITFIFGENNYQARQILNDILNGFEIKNAIEKYDGETLASEQLPDIFRGVSLFATQKLVVLYGASQNKTLWTDIAECLEEIPDELQLVFFEDTPDKRTKAYKSLQKLAKVYECKALSHADAVKWLEKEAKKALISLTPANAELIVFRAGVDQWQLHFALEKFSALGQVDPKSIEDLIEPNVEANVFELIDAALAGNKDKIRRQVLASSLSQDPYQFFGLLSGQLFQLITLAVSKKSYNEVAKDLDVHPYPLQKMSGLAKTLSVGESKKIVQLLANCDDRIKRSGAAPWEIIEVTLMKLAELRSA